MSGRGNKIKGTSKKAVLRELEPKWIIYMKSTAFSDMFK